MVRDEEIDSENFIDMDDDDDEEENMDSEPALCLFCDIVSASVEEAIDHLDTVHGIKLDCLKSKFQMDQYSFIKFINYTRMEKITPKTLLEATDVLWDDEKYFKPVEYEPWLSYDFEELHSKEFSSCPTETENVQDLKLLVEALRKKCREQVLLLEQATEDMDKMRAGFIRMVEKEKVSNMPSGCVASVSHRCDEGYFSSYAHFGIHHEMLSDVVRTTSYRDALLNNKEFISGKDVLDVGCGTSVLSIFASQAGAKLVVGIDNSDIIYNAMDIVKRNNILNISLIKGKLEDTKLPQEKYDIIISEWMGYFLLFEGMLDSVIFARDNHLKEGGMILPNRFTMSIVGYGNKELFSKHVTFWDSVYGLNMSTMKKEVMHEPLIDIVDAAHILTDANIIADLDLAKVDLNYSNFSFDFNLKCQKEGNLSAFVGYFDTFFELPSKVMFGTGPTDKPTHWKQVIFFMERPQPVKVGEVISGKIICQRSRKSVRSLDIIIEAFAKKYTYYLD